MNFEHSISPRRPPPARVREWLLPAGLLALSAVPVLAGAHRLSSLAMGPPLEGAAALAHHDARFFADPVPAVVHIVGASAFCVLGALQLAPGFRRRRPRWHRAAGRALAPLGLAAALAGLWLTAFYPPTRFVGPTLVGLRFVIGIAVMAFLVLGIDALRRRNFAAHGAWMVRAYALFLGAGTQVFTSLPVVLRKELESELAVTLCMAAGWAINAGVAEWAIHRRRANVATDRRLRSAAVAPAATAASSAEAAKENGEGLCAGATSAGDVARARG